MSRRTLVHLFSLPREVAHFILQWLPLKDLRELDNAITNHDLRPIFLSLVNGMNILKYSSGGNPDAPPWHPLRPEEPIEWILLRNLIPLEIVLFSFPPLIPVLIDRASSHLRALQFWYGTFYPMPSFRQIGHCPSLRTFLICGCKDITQEGLVRFLSLNPQLENFSLLPEECNITPHFITSLTQTSVRLKHLSLEGCFWCNDDVVPLLLSGKFDLRSLDLSCTSVHEDRSYRSILRAFPNLHRISLTQVQVSLETISLCLNQVMVPSITSSDPERQRMGLKSLVDLCMNYEEDVRATCLSFSCSHH